MTWLLDVLVAVFTHLFYALFYYSIVWFVINEIGYQRRNRGSTSSSPWLGGPRGYGSRNGH